MKVAILSAGYLPVLDGVTVSVDVRVRHLAARGHQVLLLAPDVGEVPSLPAGVIFRPLPSSPFGLAARDRNVVPAAQDVIHQALAAFQPDLIQVEEPERLALGLRRLPARAFAKRWDVPLLAFFHTNFVDYWSDGSRLPESAWAPLKAASWRGVMALYNRFNATLVPSETIFRRLIEFGLKNGVAGRFNGADTRVFSPDRRRPGYWGATWGRPDLDGRPVMLIVGRLTPDKGWSFWDEALPVLGRKLGTRLGVVVAGDGALRADVERLVAASLPHGAVLGAVPHEAMGDLLANSDIYATLSRRENASLAIYEALASGLAIIAPRAGGIPDQIRHGENGLLFPPDSLPDFVAGITRLVEDRAFATTLRAALKAERAALGWDQAFERWAAAVDRIMAAQGRAPRLLPAAP